MTVPIYIIGARGCGKTTIGYALAKILKYNFCDTDHFLQTKYNQTISEIVALKGWASFRYLESCCLQHVTTNNTVIGTGGGIILSKKNCLFMRTAGKVVYLHASADILLKRINSSPKREQRPTLTGKPINEEVLEVLLKRHMLYAQTAHYIIDASASLEIILNNIIKAVFI